MGILDTLMHRWIRFNTAPMSLYLPCGILLNLVALIQCLLLVFDPSLQDCKEDTALVRISYWLYAGIVLALGNSRFTVILFGNVNWMVMRYWSMVKAGQARYQKNHEAAVFRKVLLSSKAVMKNTPILLRSGPLAEWKRKKK